MTRHFVNAQGRYLGGFDGAEPPEGAIEVQTPPAHGHDTWNGSAWVVNADRVVLWIDQAADRARLRYVPQPSVMAEYQETEREALAFKAAGYAGDVPATVSSWAAAKNWTARQACDDILLAAAGLRAKYQQIRAVRLAGKEAARLGTKSCEQVVAELDAL